RFRGNCFNQRGSVAGALRTIPFEIRGFKELGIPTVVQELAGRPKGLILCTGPTGSGKSTTLAAVIDKVNSERRCHILTAEDPIEYLFRHKKAIINQRQVGSDTKSFANALKYVLREDPDVVMVGEMRDPETIGTTLTIAETGHLTLATLHTNSAAESIHRIIDVFPPHQQGQVRAQLAFVVEGVITQQLLPKIGGGRVLAAEVMVATPAIRALIRDEKEHQIYSALQAGAKYGMATMNQALYNLYAKRLITLETAFDYTSNVEEFEHMVEQKSAVLK
ncbi:type IV pili twitching motility protein PilT, partial [candidate division WOR-3 bacterium RBG_13_43_14]